MKSFQITLEVKAVHHEENKSSIVLVNENMNMRLSVPLADRDVKEIAIGDVLFLVSLDRKVPKQGETRRTESGSYELFDGSVWTEWTSRMAVNQ